MRKGRLAVLISAAVTLLAGSAGPSNALVDYESATERVLTAGFHLGEAANPTAITVEAVSSRLRQGTLGSLPSRTRTSDACVTIDPPGTEAATKTLCGPAEIDFGPLLSSATVTGAFHGIEFTVDFVADGLPTSSVEPPAAFSSAVAISRVGTATADLLGDAFGSPAIDSSSWYAEAKEKVKTTTSPQ